MKTLDESALDGIPARLFHSAATSVQADLYEVEWEGTAAILKDYGGLLRPRRRILGRLAGRFSVRREAEALERLESVEGIPALLARVGRYAIVQQRVPGARIPKPGEERMQPEFFRRLTALVEAMHARGVAHGDLRRSNLFTPDGVQPYIIDFETAVLRGRSARGLRAGAFETARRIDRIKVLRMRTEWFPGIEPDAEERAILSREPLLLRLGRVVRQKVCRTLKKKILRRWRGVRRGADPIEPHRTPPAVRPDGIGSDHPIDSGEDHGRRQNHTGRDSARGDRGTEG